jgi:hypothetical protein
MPLTNAGTTLIAEALFGASFTAYDAGDAFLGIGDSTAAFAKTQTGLQAATNKAYQAMDSGFPTQSGAVLTYQSTFGTASANFNWQEIALFNASAGGGTMLNRFLQSIGTKTSTQSWTLNVVITVTNP